MAKSMREEIRVADLNEPISHYTDAVRFGNLLFVSGCGPFDSNTKIVGGNDPAAQTRQTLLNMKKILNAAGCDFKDVLRVTVYLVDVNHRAKINPVRQEFFGSTRPASTLIGIKEFAIPGMLVEIEAVAGIPV